MPPGGGGLVILPQKSWNVWRNDNRERVERDKKKHEAEENARRKRQREVEAEIRLERLRGKEVSNEEAQARINGAVESMNLDDYIETKTMKELADEHTRRLERQLDRPRKRRRLKSDNPFNNNNQRAAAEAKERKVQQNEDFTPTSVPFNLFAGEDSRGARRKRRSLDKNPKREEEEKKIKDHEENLRGLAHSSVEKAKNVPWYLVTDPDEIARRMPMLPENHQNALPKRHRDFNRDERHIANRNARKKRQHDPLMEMDDILGQRPSQAEETDEGSHPVEYSDCSANFRELMSRFDNLEGDPTLLDEKKKKKRKKSKKAESSNKKNQKSKKKKKKRRREKSNSVSSSDERPRKRRRPDSHDGHEEHSETHLDRLRQERFAREERESARAKRLTSWLS